MHVHDRLAGLFAFIAFFLFFSCSPLRADVGLVLNESIGGGLNGWTGSGHAALYFSNLCPETPVKLRPCAAGEPGSIVSNYNSLGEDSGYEWNAVPLELVLYGVESQANRPLLAWPALRLELQERYRRLYLPAICTGAECIQNQDANWRDLVATSFVRDSYVFVVKTTLAQDLTVMQWLNSSPNVNHYNGFTNNCADFAARVLNSYFPGSARTDHVNDFAMTSPKAIAKSFTHYSRKHPAMQLRVLRFSQMPGAYRPSTDAKKGTEALFTSKRWLFPLLLRPHELAFFTGSYLLTGRFSAEHELQRQPGLDPANARHKEPSLQPSLRPAAVEEFVGPREPENVRLRSAIMGTKEAWKTYLSAFRELNREAIHKGLITSRLGPRRVIEMLNANGHIWFESNGAAWIDFAEEGGVARRAGLAASNINARGSDPRFAYLILLARVGAMLDRSAKNRELMPYFEQDWALLLEARTRLWPNAQRASIVPGCCGPAVVQALALPASAFQQAEDAACAATGELLDAAQAAGRFSAAAPACSSRMK
ncbi:MAG TPA: hypothetical protein VF532_03100 [Candidatus Angelobacter sp.]